MYLETVPWGALKHSRLQEFVNVSLDLLFHVTWTIPAANAVTSTVTWQWLCCWQVHILSNFMRYTGLHRLLLCQIHQCTPNTKIAKKLVGWVLLYVHRNRRLIRDGSPGRPPWLSHSSWYLRKHFSALCSLHCDYVRRFGLLLLNGFTLYKKNYAKKLRIK